MALHRMFSHRLLLAVAAVVVVAVVVAAAGKRYNKHVMNQSKNRNHHYAVRCFVRITREMRSIDHICLLF